MVLESGVLGREEEADAGVGGARGIKKAGTAAIEDCTQSVNGSKQRLERIHVRLWTYRVPC
jgi:hypothetical protein